MAVELQALEEAARAFELEADDDFVDPGRLSMVIDRLEAKRCRVLAAAKKRGDHLLAGAAPCTWVARECRISKAAAADRLCVGEQMRHLPRVSEALSAGEIGYQATAVICHLSEQLGEGRDRIAEEDWVGFAKRFSIKELRYLTYRAREAWDPDGFERSAEESHELRSFAISETLDGMYRIDGWLDPVGGAAFKAAIDALSKPLGEDDTRTAKQRRADGAVEMANHVLDSGQLPKRNGVRPHLTVHTSLEALKGELGAAASELQSGMPISSKTVQRLACDGILHRVLKADSMVVDVGRAKRTAQPAQWRALKARHKTCAWTGCDRPIGWTYAHHLEFWAHGGKTNLRKLIPLCWYHHRLVHEGGWQVLMAGETLTFIPPERVIESRRRWGERWAA